MTMKVDTHFAENAPAKELMPQTTFALGRAIRRILVVDDDARVRDGVTAVLESEGYEVFGAADGLAAVVSAKTHQPDLVVLDLNMPQMDGWTTFATLDRERPLVPVIVITARPHQYAEAVRLGVDAFMEKPLNFAVLLDAIRDLTRDCRSPRTRRAINPCFITEFLRNGERSRY